MPEGMGFRDGPLPDDLATLDHPAAAFLARLDPREVALVRTQVRRRLNAPVASSAGRLFDAAAVAPRPAGRRGVRGAGGDRRSSWRRATGTVDALAWRLDRVDGLLVYDPRPTLAALLDGVARGRSPGRLAAGFQAAITGRHRRDAPRRAGSTGVRTVCLSGGVFQNRRLASKLLGRLAGDGFEPFINRQVPVNDGGVELRPGRDRRGAARDRPFDAGTEV